MDRERRVCVSENDVLSRSHGEGTILYIEFCDVPGDGDVGINLHFHITVDGNELRGIVVMFVEKKKRGLTYVVNIADKCIIRDFEIRYKA
jgi:hypothetical protein